MKTNTEALKYVSPLLTAMKSFYIDCLNDKDLTSSQKKEIMVYVKTNRVEHHAKILEYLKTDYNEIYLDIINDNQTTDVKMPTTPIPPELKTKENTPETPLKKSTLILPRVNTNPTPQNELLKKFEQRKKEPIIKTAVDTEIMIKESMDRLDNLKTLTDAMLKNLKDTSSQKVPLETMNEKVNSYIVELSRANEKRKDEIKNDILKFEGDLDKMKKNK